MLGQEKLKMISLWHKLEFKQLIKCFCTSRPDGMFGVGGVNSELLCPGAVQGLPWSFCPSSIGDPGWAGLEKGRAAQLTPSSLLADQTVA